MTGYWTGKKRSPETIRKMSENRKGIPAWNKGLKGFRAGEKHPWMKEKLSGANNPKWKGDKVKYRALHEWVETWLGKPTSCISCGKKGTGHSIHWANVSGKYKRDLSDWKRLCAKCHSAFDKKK